MLPRTADVVIIGGGIIGSSIAYYLSKRRIAVVLLERGGMGSGTSGACDGLIFLQSKKPGALLKLALESRKRYEMLSDELGYNIEYRNDGGMIVVENELELHTLQWLMEEQKKIGLDVSLIGKSLAREMEPCLFGDLLAATYSPLDAQVNPLYLVLAFIKAAKRLGAKAFSQMEVTGIELGPQGVKSVRTSSGEVQTPIIINAAGVHAPQIGSMVHLEIPIMPRRGQLLLTEPVQSVLRTCLLSASYMAAKYPSELSQPEKIGVSIEQTTRGNFLLGSTREFVGLDWRTTWDGMKQIGAHAAKILPLLRKVRVIRTFAGLRPYTPDGLPILGRVKCLGGFIMAAGHEGDGVALSPITGELIAQLIADGQTDMDLADFRLERFNEKEADSQR